MRIVRGYLKRKWVGLDSVHEEELTNRPRQYVRTRTGNLRCFPCCSHEAHYEHSFCGNAVKVSLLPNGGEQDWLYAHLNPTLPSSYIVCELIPWNASKNQWSTHMGIDVFVGSREAMLARSPTCVFANEISTPSSSSSTCAPSSVTSPPARCFSFVPRRKWALTELAEGIQPYSSMNQETACMVAYIVHEGRVVSFTQSPSFNVKYSSVSTSKEESTTPPNNSVWAISKRSRGDADQAEEDEDQSASMQQGASSPPNSTMVSPLPSPMATFFTNDDEDFTVAE